MGRDPGQSGRIEGQRVAQLFDEYLAAAEEGRDVAAELLERAGEDRAELAARIAAERELRELVHEPAGARDVEHLGRFRILGRLGEGGLGHVYLAHDPRLGRRIALKVLQQRELLDREQSAWILNEARSLARIEHPGVVRVYEVGEADGQTFVAMEHLPGPSLQDLIQEWRRRRDESGDRPAAAGEPDERLQRLATRLAPYSARIEFLARLAEALAHCHDHGILHRDLKPANVLFDADGQPRWIDFGLAHVEGADEDSRLGLTQQLVGTAAHIAPEQVASDRTGADPRSDQFAFATLAYECFALENPFARKSRRATLDAVEAADPPPLARLAPAVPPDLARVIGHAHEREPEARYASMAALAADLRAILAALPISISEPSLARLAHLWMRRHRRGLRGAAATIALVLGLWGAAWCAQARASRTELADELSAIRPEEFARPQDFERAFAPLLALKQRALELDAQWLGARVFGRSFPAVDATVRAWVGALGESYARDSRASEESSIPFQEVMYRRLFTQEEILCAECDENLDYRARGRVRYPLADLAGKQYALDVLVTHALRGEMLTRFLPTTPEPYPIPGVYRLQVWHDEDQLEVEVVYRVEPGWPPELVVELVRPDAALHAESVEIGFSVRELSRSRASLVVPAYRILPRLVTLAEYRRFAQATGQGGKLGNSKDEDGARPAFPSLTGAMLYAAWVGGRLPLLCELTPSAEDGVVTLDEAVGGEFVLDPVSPDDLTKPGWFRHREADAGAPGGTLALVPDLRQPIIDGAGGVLRGIGFRIVFSEDRPDTYREIAATPVTVPAR